MLVAGNGDIPENECLFANVFDGIVTRGGSVIRSHLRSEFSPLLAAVATGLSFAETAPFGTTGALLDGELFESIRPG